MQKKEALRLGQLIDQLQQCKEKDEDGEIYPVVFDFCHATPLQLYSWRGLYNHLCIDYEFVRKEEKYVRLSQMVARLKEALTPNASFEGWKGGQFTMNPDIPVWVDKPREVTYTGITKVTQEDFYIIIHTAHIPEW